MKFWLCPAQLYRKSNMESIDSNVIIHPDTLHEIEKRRETSAFPFYCYNLWFGSTEKDLVPLHWHNEMEIFFTEAYGILYINDRQYDVVPGDIVFINPGLLHHSYRKATGSMFHIVFDLKLLTNPAIESDVNTIVDDLIQRKKQIIVKPEQDSELYRKLRPIVESLTEYLETEIPFGYESCRITAALFSLMSVFCQEDCFVHVEESSLYRMNHITEIIDFISGHYKSPIVVRDLSEHTGLSEGYIYNLFRDYVGVTPVGYINSFRIREAYRLLTEGLSVTETAAEVGFINVSYFIKLFKNATGMTPRSWLKNKRNSHR